MASLGLVTTWIPVADVTGSVPARLKDLGDAHNWDTGNTSRFNGAMKMHVRVVVAVVLGIGCYAALTLADRTPPEPANQASSESGPKGDEGLQDISGVQDVSGVQDRPGIQWHSGLESSTAQTPAQLRERLIALGAVAEKRHVVVQFAEPVGLSKREALGRAGLRLLSYLNDNAFFALISSDDFRPEILSQTDGLIDARAIRRNWKLHPDLIAGEIPRWAIVDAKEPGDPIVAAYVMFHRDVALTPVGVNTVRAKKAKVVSQLELVNALVIELPKSELFALADEDVVQWIEPPLPQFTELNNSNREITGANIVQESPYGLDGSGVSVLVYDGGVALASHPDFGGRLTTRDNDGLSDHATHVSGTIGGDGSASGGLYRGMAPGVTIESYGFEVEGGLVEGFLYHDPGDLEADYTEAINTWGVVISNNSIGTNTASNGFPCEWEGNYGVTGNLIDTIVAGGLGSPFRVIWANGNERSTGACGTTYNTTAPPACAKNHITVGALNSNDDSNTSFTSWGPCDDDRIKPDISAPGCQSDDDNTVTSCSSDGGYTGKCGTSMASPTVCGLSALLLQDFRIQFPDKLDFRNSTLKALLAHNAEDVGNVGPDYQNGYGSVRIQQTIDFMRTGNFLEAEVDQDAFYSVLTIVNPGDQQLKITLAWDDVPGTPNVNPVLVNDLDLRIFDPTSTQHFPWTLGGIADPASPAVRTKADHVNNIEQVVVDNPQSGVWRVEIHGFNVPEGPQVFSVTASPNLIDCSTRGVISLDRPTHACESSATVSVIDCDLNTDDETIQSVTVDIVSDTESAGETLTLVETDPASSAFDGSIPLSTTDADGTLQISPDDTITATYIDADDGFGKINVVVTATSVVDCEPPVVSNVQAPDIGPFMMTLTFDTNELTRSEIRYGTSCESLVESVSVPGFRDAHTVRMTGLNENTTYFMAIDVEDQAGNATTDDNAGACYSFSTPDIPDYFTEHFTGDYDLDNTSVLFVPNQSFDFYASCNYPITELPTDPTGGTALSLSDDDSESVTISGGNVIQLYGETYTQFFVGSNGYVTFTSGDSDYTENLNDHFSLPRISGLYDDLNPSSSGTVSWKELEDRVAVTWENVPEFSSSSTNTFQIEMYFDGTLAISALSIASSDSIVGLSAGNGVGEGFFESDLSGSGSCGPRPPNASSFTTVTDIAEPVTITLVASDDGLPDPPATISYILTSLPENGVLTDLQGGAITAVPHTLVDGGNTITYTPNQWFGGTDSFRYKANDGGVPPDGGDSNIATATITVGGPQLVYAFNFDVDPGWTVTGQWAFGQPTGSGGSSGSPDPTGGFTGDNVFGYNLNGDYVNNMPEFHLTSSAIDCSSLADVSLSFWRWLGVESSSYDHAYLRVSNDGSNWTTLWENGGSMTDNAWSQHTFDISSITDGEDTVFLRWTMGVTDSSVRYCGWNIDDVEIFAVAPLALPGDMDRDGDVELNDFSMFLDCFTGPDGIMGLGCAPADADADNDVDMQDFSIIQQVFGQ